MRRILLYDTTLRDGAQTEGITFSLNDKIAMAQRLNELGFDFIEGGYPASNDKDEQFFQQATTMPFQHSTLCAFGMTRRKGILPKDDSGLKSLLDSQAPIITIVGKSSAFQVTNVIQTSLEENLTMIAETIAWLRQNNRRIFFDAEHFFDGWKNNPEYSLLSLKTAVEAGAENVSLCDTNGGSMPEEIAQGVRDVLALIDVPVGIHTHNDCGLAVANSLAAIDAGASLVQGTINGLGERCGNADLITIAANLALKKKGQYEVLQDGSIEQLTKLSRFTYELVNQTPSHRQPFVGKSAFAHKGGMHVSGINRDTCAYEHINPQQIGNERRILISELSGKSNIIARTSKFNISNDNQLLNKILEVVARKENLGYQYEAAEGSFNLLVQKTAGLYRPYFERLNYQTSVIANAEGVFETIATVKLRVKDVIRYEVAEGDGPVNALDAALRKALYPLFPQLMEMSLIDYKVRVLNSDAATAATTRVIIESKDQDETWGTVGVSENVIEASWIALCDSIEYKLWKNFYSGEAETTDRISGNDRQEKTETTDRLSPCNNPLQ
ncbi:MAG: citramalate synthase [Planctomycetia bacterium]|nr:citramalate synthase [Planctomycetia bacterium]